jgi:cell wall-associated NlpC family hydrolase
MISRNTHFLWATWLLATAVVLLAGACAPASANPAPVRYEIYMVQTGDTVENIAARFGVEAALIRNFNNLAEGQALTTGQSLAVVLPGRPEPKAGEGQATDAIAGPAEPQEITPRYAVVGKRCQITGQPGGGSVLYEPVEGSRVIVGSEQGDYWGVVMANGMVGWTSKASLQATEDSLSPEDLDKLLRQGGRAEVVQYAMRFLGTPYRYGGRLPYDTDCSLFVQTVFAAFGVALPRTAHAQIEVGQAVPFDQMLPGDRLYFANRSGYVNHTAIYIGEMQFIHASSYSGCVTIDSLAARAYWTKLVCVRRS